MPRMTPYSAGHGATVPPHVGGGEGGHGGDDNRPDSVPDYFPNYGERLRRARMGLAIAMTPVLMLFISFTTVYIIRRGYLGIDATQATNLRTWIPVQLPWPILVANTAILVLSSITIDFARRSITREAALAPVRSIPGITLGKERHFPWLAVTTILGMLFVAGQLYVWTMLSNHGFHFSGTSSSFVYILTAMHALHLTGGILALLSTDVMSVLHRPIEARRIVVDVTSWYWHCMTGLWIYILVLFSFAA